MPHLLVITGASRGLGAALAELALQAGHRVLAVARNACAGDWLQADLTRPDVVERPLERAIAERVDADVDGYTLVNNAATVEPIGSEYDAAAVSMHIGLNLTAAIVATRAFVRALEDVDASKCVVNVSSGAATRAIEGWSLYCASKAGLEHFGRCLALEQARARFPVDVANLSPGVIDTDMQARIRNADPAEFPDRDHFRDLKLAQRLIPPAVAAEKILAGILGGRRFDGATVGLSEFASETTDADAAPKRSRMATAVRRLWAG